jgi:hypothetical protein
MGGDYPTFLPLAAAVFAGFASFLTGAENMPNVIQKLDLA